MTIMLAKTYAALKAAGVPEAQAQAAVEELGSLNDQFGGLSHAMHEMHADVKSELVGVRADFKSELGDVKSEVANVRSEVAYLRGRFDVLIWAVGINAAATIAILGVLLRH
jgi:uncharacterized protein YpuA (DUF1002 family)